MNLQKARRRALVTASSGFLVGFAFLNGGPAQSIGGLCNGTPASHTWLDASGQYGPALIDGTDGDDVIIGSDGDDHIDAGPGDDVVCGGAGHNHIHGGEGHDALIGSADHDHLDGGDGDDTVVAFGGDDTVAGGPGYDVLLGGDGDDVMISVDSGHDHGGGGHIHGADAGHGGDHAHDEGHGDDHAHDDGPPARAESELDEVYAGDGFDVCLMSAGDEVRNCEY